MMGSNESGLCPKSHISGCKGNHPGETVSSVVFERVILDCLTDVKAVFNVYGDPNEWAM